MVLSGPIDRILASYNEDSGVNGIAFFRGDKYKSYGKIGDKHVNWYLDEN